MRQIKARVIANGEFLRYPGTVYFLMRVHAPEIAAAGKPGQFCMLHCGPDSLLRRPLSIHAATSSGELSFLYDNSGKGKVWLSRMAAGSELDIIGPLGNGFDIEEKANNILLAAGGIGIAPLAFLAERCAGLGKEVTLLAGARCRAGLYPASLLPPEIRVITAVEKEEDSGGLPLGKVTDILPGHIDSADQVFACGPRGMLEAIRDYMDNMAVTKPVQVSLEVRMGCGLGTCYGCSIRTKQGMQRVCREGPVFNIKDIIWQEVTL